MSQYNYRQLEPMSQTVVDDVISHLGVLERRIEELEAEVEALKKDVSERDEEMARMHTHRERDE